MNAPAEPSVPAHPPIIDISASRSKEEIAADIMDAGKNVGWVASVEWRVWMPSCCSRRVTGCC